MTGTAKPKALIADDESHIRLMITTVLTSMGFEVVGEAADGQQAVDLFKQHAPELTLLDINMPNKTGLEALEEIMAAFDSGEFKLKTGDDVSHKQSWTCYLPSGTYDWTTISCPLATTTDTYNKHLIRFVSRGSSGTLYFDDVRVTRTDSSASAQSLAAR